MNDSYEAIRADMVAHQIEERGVFTPRVLEVFRSVPRHRFVPAALADKAYDDKPLPIGSGQTISQPYIVALMTDLLQLKGPEKVLEIGTGSGYQAAILAQLARTVHTIEREPLLAQNLRELLPALGYSEIVIHEGDGCLGWPDAAPYDAILITAAAPAPPPLLLQQLADEGRLVLPVGGPGEQMLQVWQRHASGFYSETVLSVSFVPMRGSCGWSETDWPDPDT